MTFFSHFRFRHCFRKVIFHHKLKISKKNEWFNQFIRPIFPKLCSKVRFLWKCPAYFSPEMSHALEFNEDDLQKIQKKIRVLTRPMVHSGEKASSLKQKSAILKHPIRQCVSSDPRVVLLSEGENLVLIGALQGSVVC